VIIRLNLKQTHWQLLAMQKLKLEFGKFLLCWDKDPNPLVLDFNPLISRFFLEGEYLLIHWQARPKGVRKWGFYDSASDDYYCPKFQEKISLPLNEGQLLQVDENVVLTVPTAVIYLSDVTYVDVLNES
jgi:hypothetical protein